MCTGCLQTRLLPSSKMPDTVLMMSEGQESFSKDSYCILTRISRVLKDVYGVTANSISSFLRQAGYTVNDVGRYIITFMNTKSVLFLALGYCKIFTARQRTTSLLSSNRLDIVSMTSEGKAIVCKDKDGI